MNPILNIAIRAARIGGNFLIQNYDSKYLIKNTEDNIISKYIEGIYKKCFITILKNIQKTYPEHTILDYKKKITISKNNIYQWIVNPLNGKINFIYKIPIFCISIDIRKKDLTIVSVIYDPINNDLFTAIKGKGAYLNGYRIRCNDKNHFPKSVISIYIKNSKFKKPSSFIFFIEKLIHKKINIRYSGCPVLDLAYLASGKIDCFIGYNIKNLNMISGKLHIQESGALINYNINCKKIDKNKIFFIGNIKYLKLISNII